MFSFTKTSRKQQQRRSVLSLVIQLGVLLYSVSLFDTISSSISVTAFAPVALSSFYTQIIARKQTTTSISGSFFVDGTSKQEKTTDIEPVLDKKGKTVTVGAVVRIAVEGLEAYQILPKAKGIFNEKKEFVPDTSDSRPIGRRCLVLPVGLRGTVVKVFDIDDVSANFPVQVKFQPDTDTEEGYNTPVPFLMHFQSDEIELVED